MILENISTSITEPVTLIEVKEHLRIEENHEDDYLTVLIKAAREQAEAYCETVIPSQLFRLTLDCFPSSISIQKVPLISVESISYTDTAGDAQALAQYYIQRSTVSADIKPLYGESFPGTEDGRDKVVIEFTAGYDEMPETIKHAIKLIAGSLYEQREDHSQNMTLADVPWSSKALLNGFKRIVI